jgi:cell division septation protein DedD
VAIVSYTSFDDALARQKELMREDMPVYIAPTPVRGVIYYRVYAGLLADRGAAEALMARLVREGVKEAAGAWDVRPARYAFDFGVYPSLRDARAVIETLLGQGVPAYAVPAPGDAAGAAAYHVYAGGYETPEDARPLEEVIDRAGLDAELVERVGVPLR